MNEEYVSLKPSDAYHGTGMIPEGDYTIAAAKFDRWDYAGTQPNAVPALSVEYKTGDQSYIQWYSAGDMKNLRPSDDGKRLVKIGSSGGLNDGCNCYQFMNALLRAGFPEDRIADDISVLVGLEVNVVHEPTKEREIRGEKKKAGVIAVVGKILNDPGDMKAKGKGKAAPAAVAAKAKANGAETDEAVGPKTTAALVKALKGADNHTLDKKALSSALFKQISGNDPDRPRMLNLIIQDSYLGSLTDHGVLYDVGSAQIMYVGE